VEREKKDGISRRGFLKAAGVMGAVAIAKNATAQMPTLVAANPLVGTIDMHVHAGPDTASRSVNDFELTQKAKELGMRGVVTKIMNLSRMTAPISCAR